ncbi:MAG: type III pantothenate kinase [Gemmatimonadetes bacterium]|nr:type III pantothenate kinase [Gemmatimonadota bacterium]
MILLVDSGNSRTRFVFVEAKRGTEIARATVRSRGLDSIEAVRASIMTAAHDLPEGRDAGECEGSAYATVVPAREEYLRNGIRRALGKGALNPIAVGPSLDLGIELAVDRPDEVGPDRIANAVAAFAEYGGPVIAIDAGTALTMEVVDAGGRFLGGIITLGPGSVRDAVGERGARLHAPELIWPERVIGANTEDALRSGIVRGSIAAVDGLVASIRSELGERAKVVATGGLGSLIADHAESVDVCDAGLTLKGLKRIYDRNRPNRRGAPSKS